MRQHEPVTEMVKASEARQQFSRLLNRVFRGEARVVVSRAQVQISGPKRAAERDLGGGRGRRAGIDRAEPSPLKRRFQ